MTYVAEYLKNMWWHQCNDFHGSLWLSNNALKCCYCGTKKEDGKSADFKDGGNIETGM